jgi:RTX calcium-binding nonapeptide repeat (4 copies)
MTLWVAMGRRIAIVAVLLAGIAAASTATGSGTSVYGVTCSFSPSTGVLSIDLHRSNTTRLFRHGDEIQVYALRPSKYGSYPERRVSCTDSSGGSATPTVASVTRIRAEDSALPEDTSPLLLIDLSGGPLGPGRDPEGPGPAEIELAYDTPTAESRLSVSGAGHDIELGSPSQHEVRANLNAEAERSAKAFDADLLVSGGVASVDVSGGGPSGVRLDARGGNGLGGAVLAETYLSAGDGRNVLAAGAGYAILLAGRGDDTLIGGRGVNQLIDAGGDDRLVGGAGGDYLDADPIGGPPGNDVVLGGPGRDETSFVYEGDVHVDLRKRGRQDTGGAGRDVIRSVEKVHVLDGTVIGDEADNLLSGSSPSTIDAGNERLIGGGGDDRLKGDFGDDILKGGSGDDLLIGDRLRLEDYHDDMETFGASRDVLFGQGGNDVLWAEDFRRDRLLSCGRGPNREQVVMDPIDPRPFGC